MPSKLLLLIVVALAAASADAQVCAPLPRTGFVPGPQAFVGTIPAGSAGQPGSVDLSGADLHVSGESIALSATATLREVDGGGAYYFRNATVAGEAGSVLVEAATLTATATLRASTSVLRAEVTDVAVRLVPRLQSISGSGAIPNGVDVDAASSIAAAERSTWRRMASPMDNITITAATRVLFFPASGPMRALAQPAVVTSGELFATEPTLRVDSASLSASKWLVGGESTGGSVVVGVTPRSPRPDAVAGQTGTIALTAGRAQVTNTRITQVFDPAGPRLTSSIQVTTSTKFRQDDTGGDIFIGATVSERSKLATAHLDHVEVEGCVPVGIVAGEDDGSPLYVLEMVEIVGEAGWAAPVVAVAFIVVAPFVFIADVVSLVFCAFFGCSTGTGPEGYPSWVEPGQTRTFDLYADLDGVADGEYPTVVRFVGKNHPPAELRFIIRVGAGDTPAAWTCGDESWGTFGDCDCGCGTVDVDCPDSAASSCDEIHCGVPDGVRPELLNNADTSQCAAPADGWLCAVAAKTDAVCDCGCGVADSACADGRASCFGGTARNRCGIGTVPNVDDPGVCLDRPAAWICGNSYSDGICNCGCGAVDVDCADASLASCETDRCGNRSRIDPDDVASCLDGVPDAWTCSNFDFAERGTFATCECGCGVVDPDCGLTETVDCDNNRCGLPAGTREDLVDPDDSGQCLPAPPGTWACAFAAQTDDRCDCGCGIPDDACADRSACFASGSRNFCGADRTPDVVNPGLCVPLPPDLACDPERLGDGVCDCGCGVDDPDCAGAERCERDACPRGEYAEPAASGTCLAGPPPGWTCDADVFNEGDFFSTCDCGCGVVDGDCDLELRCDRVGCDSGVVDPADPTTCVELPAAWTCGAEAFGSDDCVCGCGALNPACPADADLDDCRIIACGENGRLVDESLTSCVDVGDWSCAGASFGTGDGCDCGCGALDPDCGAGATLNACDRTGPCTLVDDDDLGRCDFDFACDASLYNDGTCDCGCRGQDPDCADLDASTCGRAHCGTGDVVDAADNRACVTPPLDLDDDDDDAPFLSCGSAGVGPGPGLVALLLLGRRRRRGGNLLA